MVNPESLALKYGALSLH